MTIRVWTCQRRVKGAKCGTVNPLRKWYCDGCGKKRTARPTKAQASVALSRSYEEWVAEFGELCGICGRGPSAKRGLDRDHDHGTDRDRGLLCWRCNKFMQPWMTSAWLRAAADYLDRAGLAPRR